MTRIIKKYPNRRLYDTQESHYITLNDIRELVVEGADFEVIDKKTGEDITRSILLQIIAEQEQTDESVMSEDFLAQVIRAYSGTMPDLMSRYLEQSVGYFLNQQQRMSESYRELTGTDPVSAMTKLTQHNMNQWLDWQRQWLDNFSPNRGKK